MFISNKIFFCFVFLNISCTKCLANDIKIGQHTFVERKFTVGAGQSEILVCDFNNDGAKDIIVTNQNDNNIITFKGYGDGSLTKVSHTSVGETPSDITATDFNNDRRLDLAIANHETDYVTFLIGDGKGQFRPAKNSPFRLNVNPHPHVVKLADLNDDGFDDLIVDSRDNDGLLVLKGLKEGAFSTTEQIISMGGDPYRGFAIGDINNDGKLDIVTPNAKSIGIALNQDPKNLNFDLMQLSQLDSPFSVSLADMNRDGNLDLIIASNGTSLSLIPGDGKGNFNIKEKIDFTATAGAKQITIGDINNDGIQDALISNWSGQLTVIFGSKKEISSFNFYSKAVPNPWAVKIADLNTDNIGDIIITDGNSKKAVVYISQVE